ncbi:MAG: hypothetical protein IT367_07210 [Candidatus Hydrogenedentes bacterium]|nr:hypothetical protein [Candidatus Hydrogenedentota bacterium]
MNIRRNIRGVKHGPARAALTPIWEFIFISESFLGLFGGFAGIGLQFLSALTSLTLALADFFGDSSTES